MHIPKVYLETSIFNFVFTNDAPDKREDALKLFAEIRQGRYEPYASEYVLQELRVAPEPKKANMVNLFEQYGVVIVPQNFEAERLADIYTREGVIPVKYITDAVHIAVATVNDLDFIVSYNFKHIVRECSHEIV